MMIFRYYKKITPYIYKSLIMIYIIPIFHVKQNYWIEFDIKNINKQIKAKKICNKFQE